MSCPKLDRLLTMHTVSVERALDLNGYEGGVFGISQVTYEEDD